jgi:hypothetical protein
MEVDIPGTGIGQLINFVVVVNIAGVTGSINTLLEISYLVIDELQLDSIAPSLFCQIIIDVVTEVPAAVIPVYDPFNPTQIIIILGY